MGKDLAKLEPIPLPDLRRTERMPSLPEWLTSRVNAASSNLQLDPRTGSFRDLLTLPAARLPTDTQRAAIVAHCAALRRALGHTPENGEQWEAETLATVTKLLLTLPGMRTSEQGAESKGEAYMAALDDVPSWAVAEAVRGWYRGSHPARIVNGKSVAYDFRWAPAPAELRTLSVHAATKFEIRAREAERLLDIVPFDPTAEAHCAKMRERLRTELPWLVVDKDQPRDKAGEAA